MAVCFGRRIFSLSPLDCALPVTHMSYSSLFIFELYVFHGFMLLCNLFVSKFTPLFPAVFRSLSLAHRACLPYVLFLSFYIRIYLFHSFMLLCICFTISLHSPPRFFAPSLAHRTFLPYGPFPPLLQHMVPSHNHTRIPCFIPLAPSPVLSTL